MNRRRQLLVVLGLPTLVWLAAVAVSLVLRGSLPRPMAVHFDLAGSANGYLSFAANLLLLTVVLALLLAGFGAFGLPRHRPPAIVRAAGMLATGTSVLLAGVQILLVLVQRNLTTASSAELNPSLILTPLVLAGGAAAGVHLLLPLPSVVTSIPDPDAPRLPLSGTAVAVWTRHQSMPMPAVVLPVLIALGLLIAGFLTWAWPLLLIGVLLGVLAVGMGWWTVTVDGEGVRYVSILGWPRRTIPLEAVLDAEVVQVRPLKDAGGWGIRMNRAGETGLYLRAGPALHVRLMDGRGLVITVDDAVTAAGLLNSLRDRVR